MPYNYLWFTDKSDVEVSIFIDDLATIRECELHDTAHYIALQTGKEFMGMS